MSPTTDQTIHDLLAGAVTTLVVAYALLLLVRALGRSRPGLSIGVPMMAALGIRVLAAAGVSFTGIARSLRGGDEVGFLADARELAATPLDSSLWTDAFSEQLHVFVLAGQSLILDSPEFVLRISQAGIGVAGLALLAVAVYELAGPRAALIAAWLLALEPTSIFFGTLLHKESNMLLAAGLVAFGGSTMWKRGDLRSLLPIALGCLVAVTTRPYAGWFLIAAGAAITLHAGLRSRKRDRSTRALALVAIVVLLSAVAAPTVWEASSEQSLQENLQRPQDATTETDDSNLALERVDFSTREAIIVNLPTRVVDVILRPFPWQLANASQQFGALGTILAYVLFAYLASILIRSRGAIMERAGPLIYVGLFLLVAYALSAGNAGTAFRYRTHIVALAIAALTALWAAYALQADRRPARRPATGPLAPQRVS